MAKTDWQMNDTVLPADLNQIGQEINDNAAEIADHKSAPVLDHPDGSVTTAKLADGAVTAAKVAADVAKAADLAAHAATTTGVHGATSAATPNRIVQRDSAGRAKVAAPAAADDIARKDTVDAVQSNLTNHIGSGGSAHAVATTSQAGFMSASDKSKLNGIQAGAQVNAVTSVAGKTGAVTLSKSDVGLGSVQNYGIATQAQAEAGTASNVYMTPQRTKQYVDTRLANNLSFRISGGVVQYNDGSGWKSMAGIKSVQRGVAELNSVLEITVTISSVNLNKSFVIISFSSETEMTSAGHALARALVRAELTSATQLKLIRQGDTLSNVKVAWQVIEFY